MEYTILHNRERRMFEADFNGEKAYVTYKLSGKEMTITKTFVPKSMEGQGVASALVNQVYNYATENELKIFSRCSYATAWLKRHMRYLPIWLF